MAAPTPGTGRDLVASAKARRELTERVAAVTAQLTTNTLKAMEERLPWFMQLDAEARSWITLVARSGIDGFAQWFADDPDHPYQPATVFAAAPRALTSKISLHQTVALVRTTIEVVAEQFQAIMPESDREILSTAILHFSRELAFAAAEVYAVAAERRGAWDARIEALVVDAIVRAETDESVVSRASALGWRTAENVCVLVGNASLEAEDSSSLIRRRAEKLGVDALVANLGERIVVVLGSQSLETTEDSLRLAGELSEFFGEGHIVAGGVVNGLVEASTSARAAISGLRASVAWPEGERCLAAGDLLPERALSGDGHARRTLVTDVFRPLQEAGGDLLETCVGFLDSGSSVEATARAMFVHANTVRYRLKRIQDLTGYNPADAREAFVLRMAITLGRLQD